MAKSRENYLNAEVEIVMIELLSSSMNMPVHIEDPRATNFKFDVDIESSTEADNRLIFVMVHVEVTDDDTSALLAAFTVSCVFEIDNFTEVVKIKADGTIEMSQKLIETLNTQAIATTRGVMYATFKGTFLHHAILPVKVIGQPR